MKYTLEDFTPKGRDRIYGAYGKARELIENSSSSKKYKRKEISRLMKEVRDFNLIYDNFILEMKKIYGEFKVEDFSIKRKEKIHKEAHFDIEEFENIGLPEENLKSIREEKLRYIIYYEHCKENYLKNKEVSLRNSAKSRDILEGIVINNN